MAVSGRIQRCGEERELSRARWMWGRARMKSVPLPLPFENAFEHLPETVQGTARELLSGVYKFEDRLLLILDLDRVVNFAIE